MNCTHVINVVLIIFIFISISCSLSSTEKADYKMEIDKLTLVIRDMNLIELIIENKPVNIKDSLKKLNLNRLCSLHQTTIEVIEHDLELISTDYLLLDSLYGRIILMDTTKKSISDINSPPK